MTVSKARAFEPMRAPKTSIRVYGAAARWAGPQTGPRPGPSAFDVFSGPRRTGVDWAAAFATASGGATDRAIQEWVKRNVDKFSGPVLQAFLEQTNLVDWYRDKMSKEAEEASRRLQESIDSMNATGDGSLLGGTAQSILRQLSLSSPAVPATAAPAATTATDPSPTPVPDPNAEPGSLVDVTL